MTTRCLFQETWKSLSPVISVPTYTSNYIRQAETEMLKRRGGEAGLTGIKTIKKTPLSSLIWLQEQIGVILYLEDLAACS